MGGHVLTGRGAAPGADRPARLHRIDAYRAVLDLVDPVLAEHISTRLLEAPTAGGVTADPSRCRIAASLAPTARLRPA